MASVKFSATPRTDAGTGVARKLRQSGQLPAVIYGHGREPQPLVLNTRDFEKLLDKISYGSTVIELDIAGTPAVTLIREVQRHPFKKMILHVDFQELVAGEKVTVSVPLVFVGVPDGVRNSGGILDQVMHEISIHVDPALIPNHVDVDVTPLAIGHSFHVGDLKLPEGVEVLDEPGTTICVVSAPKAAVEETPVVAAEPGAEAPAEPELIRKAKAEDAETEK
ncbi:MAG TPA: 50S ribosomal protein L25 [Gemmatimonadaceae bacterium]|nr:50S ribosomal protein L25 [Gemmatimonadaceae bacterium]